MTKDINLKNIRQYEYENHANRNEKKQDLLLISNQNENISK